MQQKNFENKKKYKSEDHKFTGKKRGASEIKIKNSEKAKKKTEKQDKTEESNFQELLETLILTQKNNNSENEEEGLIVIKPLYEYVKEKKEEWKNKNKNFDMEKFAKSIGIINEFNYNFLKEYIEKDIDILLKYYQYFQLSLTIEQRKEIQEKIKEKCNLPIVRNNYINNNIKSIKNLFYNVCNTIIDINIKDINNDFENAFKNIFLSNGVYSEKHFESFIPVEFGNNELKFNKLIFEIIDFFF